MTHPRSGERPDSLAEHFLYRLKDTEGQEIAYLAHQLADEGRDHFLAALPTREEITRRITDGMDDVYDSRDDLTLDAGDIADALLALLAERIKR